MLKTTALFLLDTPPLDEISDDLHEVVEKFRYKLLTKKQAIDILTSKHKEKLLKLDAENQVLHSELS